MESLLLQRRSSSAAAAAAAKKLVSSSSSSSRKSSFADLMTARVVKADYKEGEVMYGRGIGHWIHSDEVEEEEEEEEGEGSPKSLFGIIRRKLGAGQDEKVGGQD